MLKQRLFMTKGLPASGKTTWAASLTKLVCHIKRVNKDDLRQMLDGGCYTKANEKFVLHIRDRIISEALLQGKEVIVDDTNLAPVHEETLRQLASKFGAQFEIQDFTGVPVETCIERDLQRARSVGSKVIYDMYYKYLWKKPAAPAFDASLPKAIIVDIDGTVALRNGRGPFDWHRVGEDDPNLPVCSIVRSSDVNVAIFVSGRSAVCRKETLRWLIQHDLMVPENSSYPHQDLLYMRDEGDMRDDRIVKREIYDRHIAGKYNVRFVLDDRPKVIRMWRELGLTVLDCGDGREF
jgi:predicted kinase